MRSVPESGPYALCADCNQGLLLTQELEVQHGWPTRCTEPRSSFPTPGEEKGSCEMVSYDVKYHCLPGCEVRKRESAPTTLVMRDLGAVTLYVTMTPRDAFADMKPKTLVLGPYQVRAPKATATCSPAQGTEPTFTVTLEYEQGVRTQLAPAVDVRGVRCARQPNATYWCPAGGLAPGEVPSTVEVQWAPYSASTSVECTPAASR